MLQIESKLALSQLIGSLPMTFLIVLLLVSLGYIFYNLYKNSREKTNNMLETILETNKKILLSNLEISKQLETNNKETKLDREMLKETLKEHTNKVIEKTDKISNVLSKTMSYKFTGKGITNE